MLLQRLGDHAARLDLTPAMYLRTPIRWLLDLDSEGRLLGPPVRTEGSGGRNDRGKEFLAPHRERTVVLRSVPAAASAFSKAANALPIWSDRLGLVGKADVVEYHGDVPYPVEYKHGNQRRREHDDLQLCAQALCLEERTVGAMPLCVCVTQHGRPGIKTAP